MTIYAGSEMTMMTFDQDDWQKGVAEAIDVYLD